VAEVTFGRSTVQGLRVGDVKGVNGYQIGIGNWVGIVGLVQMDIDGLGLVEIIEGLN